MDGSIASRPETATASLRAFLVRGWRPLALGAIALAVAVGALALTRTSLFRVRTIEVEGASHLSQRDIVRRAGLSLTDNAVWLDEAWAERRLASDPWVAGADVRVDLPWTVTVTVTERVPVGIVDRGGALTLVAADGTNLGRPSRRADLPTITAPPAWVAGSADAAVVQVAGALGAMNEDLRGEVRRVTLGPSGIELLLRDGVRVLYGSGRAPEAKATAIAEVLRWAAGSGERIRSINVAAPGAPAVVPMA